MAFTRFMGCYIGKSSRYRTADAIQGNTLMSLLLPEHLSSVIKDISPSDDLCLETFT